MKIIPRTKLWFSISSLLILISLIFFGLNISKNGSFINYGIHFTGGSMVELELDDESKSSLDIRSAFDNFSDYSPQIQETQAKTFNIKMKSLSQEEHENLIDNLSSSLGGITEKRFITIGPSVGETMKSKAVWALVIALVAIVIYIAYSFQEVRKSISAWKLGFSAIIALTHDILLTLGLFSALGYFYGVEVDMLFITALLTIMGFSVHDTIVLFDRFRENIRLAKASETLDETGEKSVQQSLSRSINTSVSTLFPLIALIVPLYYFAFESEMYFILALIFGIIIGTYSSIFLATPVVIMWSKETE